MGSLAFVVAGMVLIGPGTAEADPSGWRWPLDGRPSVIRRFDPPRQPWLAGHRGVDLAAWPGRLVHAAGAGTVGFARDLAGRGVVVITHAHRLRTTYLPVLASVRPGERVRAGDPIGVVEGSPGHCTTSCLHWGLRRGDAYLDPLLLVGAGQVRLLPRWSPSAAPRLAGDPRLDTPPGALFGALFGLRPELLPDPPPGRRPELLPCALLGRRSGLLPRALPDPRPEPLPGALPGTPPAAVPGRAPWTLAGNRSHAMPGGHSADPVGYLPGPITGAALGIGTLMALGARRAASALRRRRWMARR